MDEVVPGRPQSFRYRRRPGEDCNLGRGQTAQDGGARDGTFHGEMDRCRESSGWTRACSSMAERDVKNQGQDSPNKACSGMFACHSWLATSSVNVYLPCVWFGDGVLAFSGVSFILFFVFVSFSFSSLCCPSFNRSQICVRSDGQT